MSRAVRFRDASVGTRREVAAVIERARRHVRDLNTQGVVVVLVDASGSRVIYHGDNVTQLVGAVELAKHVVFHNSLSASTD